MCMHTYIYNAQSGKMKDIYQMTSGIISVEQRRVKGRFLECLLFNFKMYVQLKNIYGKNHFIFIKQKHIFIKKQKRMYSMLLKCSSKIRTVIFSVHRPSKPSVGFRNECYFHSYLYRKHQHSDSCSTIASTQNIQQACMSDAHSSGNRAL